MIFLPPSEDETVTTVEGPDTVLLWRIEYLLRAGYDDEAAQLIAEDREVDLHRASGLLEKGCSIGTALLILL